MALADIQKVQIVAHGRIMMDVLSLLQEEEIVHLGRMSADGGPYRSSSPDLSDLEQRLHRISSALEFLNQSKGRGFLARMMDQKLGIARKTRHEVFSSAYLPLLREIEALEAEINTLFSRIRFLEKEKESLIPLKSLELPLSDFTMADTVDVHIGTLPSVRYAGFMKIIEDEALWHAIISQEKGRYYLLLICSKKERERLDEILNNWDFVLLPFTEAVLQKAGEQGTVREVIEKIDAEIEEAKKKLDTCAQARHRYCEHREKLMIVHDVCLSEQRKLSSSRLLGLTEQTFLLEGWVRSSEVDKLSGILRPYADMIEIYSREPLADEDPPVLLENPNWIRPFELLTRLYGLPSRGSLDPTLSLAPFFFIFVGLCVSEAGYGLLVAVMSFAMITVAKPRGGQLQFLRLLLLLGISNVVLGTLFGGWFGFTVRQLLIIDPVQDPLSFLYLSLTLGFLQVWFGILLNMIEGMKSKQYFRSLFVQGGWLVLLPSLMCYGLTGHPLWGIVSLISAAGIVIFASSARNPVARFLGGLYNLYGISGYLSDVLSYSRLLALGLSTSVIAMVVNELAKTTLAIPWIGWTIAALVFVCGHLFNLAISFLGGFVHSMRLQYVEFFRQFFRPGGKAFKPFGLEGRYVEFI